MHRRLKTFLWLAFTTGILGGLVSPALAAATSSAKHERRFLSRQAVENHPFTAIGQDYIAVKNRLADKWGLQIGVDISYTPQRISPEGKQTSVQGYYYPYLTWTFFQNRALGSGVLNVNYNLVRYWGQEASVLQGRGGVASAFNDAAADSDTFSQLSYTHTLPGAWDWLSFTVGQFPIYNFDGSEYTGNQQTGLMNYALSQNASAAYPSGSLGAYVQVQKPAWALAAGYQDASNLSGEHIQGKTAFGGQYTGFGSLTWTPSFKWGGGQYSLLYYYQPAVEETTENVHGWSVNAQQNIASNWVLFGRANGSTDGAAPIKNSYVLGVSLLDPLGRNPQDVITFGAAYNRLSAKGLNPIRSGETVLELQWVWGIGKFVTLTPDLQVYPRGGLNAARQVVTAVGLRTTVML